MVFSNLQVSNKYHRAKGHDVLLLETANLLISSPQVKTFMILTYLNINPKLLIKLVASEASSG